MLKEILPFKRHKIKKTGKSFLIFSSILVLVCLLISGCGKEEEISKTDFMMDTFITQVWHGENAVKCYEEIKETLNRGEELLSTFKEGSEIALINSAGGKNPVKVSREVFEILKESKEFSSLAGGKFDITVAPLVKLWDVTSQNPKVPDISDIEEKKKLISFQDLILDEESSTAFLKREGMEIDLGAVLKGYFAEKCLLIAQENEVSGYISVGGDMAVAGKKKNGADYIMGIRNPRGEGNDYIGTLSMDGLTMATAGDYERFFTEDGKRYHHILDPFTGFPAETDIISATVLSENGILADFLSTYIFMGGTESLEDFKGYDSFDFLAVDRDLNVYMSDGFQKIFTPSPDKKEFNFIK